MSEEMSVLNFEVGKKHLLAVEMDTNKLSDYERTKAWIEEYVLPGLWEWYNSDEPIGCLVLPSGINVRLEKVET